MKNNFIAMIKQIARPLCVLTLVALLAGCSSDPTLAINKANDVSLNLLSEILGSLNSLNGSIVTGNVTVVQRMIGLFNHAIVTVVGLTLALGVFQHVIKASTSHALQGAKTGGMQLFRVAVGLALVVPVSLGSGNYNYSILQRILFGVVEHSVSLANDMYKGIYEESVNHQLKFFDPHNAMSRDSKGDELAGSKAGIVDDKIVDDKKESSQLHTAYQDAGNTESSLFKAIYKQYNDYLSGVSGAKLPSRQVTMGVTDLDGLSLKFTENSNAASVIATVLESNYVSMLPAAAAVACYHNYKTSPGPQVPSSDKRQLCPDYFVGSTYQNPYDGLSDNGVQMILKNKIQNAIMTATQSFVAQVTLIPTSADSQKHQNVPNGGWMTMGMNMLKLAESNTYDSSTEFAKTAAGGSPGWFSDIARKVKFSISGGDQTIGSYASLPWPTGFDANIKNYWRSNSATSSSWGNFNSISARLGAQTYALGGALNTASAVVGGVANSLSKSLMDAISKVQVANPTAANPIVLSRNIGKVCSHVAVTMWATLAALMVTMSITATCSCEQPAFIALVQVPMMLIKPMLSLLFTALLTVGIVLGFWLPLFPALLFAFVVIGRWLLPVITSVLAVVLIALGLTHPEDHDMMVNRRAEQGFMLVLHVYLQPALIVMSMTISIALLYSGLYLVNQMFSRVLYFLWAANVPSTVAGNLNILSAIQNAVGHWHGSFGDLVGLVGLIVVYMTAVYNVVLHAFDLGLNVIKYINQWIGTPALPDCQSMDYARGTLGPLSSMGGQVGGAFAATADGGADAANQIAKETKPSGGGNGGGGGGGEAPPPEAAAAL